MLVDFEMFGERPAIVWRDQVFSYAWLLQRIKYWSAALARQSNIEAGSVVALSAHYSPNAIALFLALLDMRCIVSLTTTVPPGQRDATLQLAEVQVEFVVDDEENVAQQKVGYATTHPLLLELSANNAGGLVLFTSGSAGKVKAVVHDATKLFRQVGVRSRARRTIPFMLFDHIGGVNTVMQTLASGGIAVVAHARDPHSICALIEKHRVQVLPATPTFLNLLLLSDFENYDLSSLQIVGYGAERMPASLLARISEALPGVKLVQNYGLSEAGVFRTHSPSNDSLWMKLGGDGTAFRVVEGMLEVKADSTMLGYLNHPSPFTHDGWLRTGDRVEVNGDMIRVAGRNTDLINVGGEKVDPAEIEDLIVTMPDVADVIVRGEPNVITGQIVHAEVQLSGDETREAFRRRVTDFLSGKVAPHKIPQRVTVTRTSLQTARLKKRRSE